MKDIIHILKRKYNDALTNTSMSEELKNRERFNYFSALILQRGSFNVTVVEEQISKASGSDKESLKDFYLQIEHTVKALEREGFMVFDTEANSYLFSSEQWRDKLEKRLKFLMVSKDDTIINFKNDEVKTALGENLKTLHKLLNSDEDELMKFLYTASKMLPFSFNNKVMAHIQSMERSLVIDSLQSIDFWNQKKAYIKKGEKGIDLIVPSRFPLFEYEEGRPKLDIKGRKILQLDEEGHFKFGLRFVLKKSFDKSQVNLNQYQRAEYHIRNDYEKITTELKYAISKSPLSKHIHFGDFESKEDEVVDLFAQISNNFSGTEEQRNALKYLFSAYSDLYIPHQRDYPTSNNEQLSELKEAIEYSKTVARILNIEHIFFFKEKNIYALKGKEDALSRGSKHVTLNQARENAKEIDRIEYQAAYLNEFKNEYKRGYSNEKSRTRNIYNSDDRERSERAGHQPSEASSQRANQREETGRVQGQQSQRDTQPNADTDERGGVSREGSLGDRPREILSSERRGVESSLVKLYDHLGEQTYNAVVFEENFPFMEALNRFGKETIEDFPNFKNQQHLKEALENPNQYNILEVENYHGSSAHYLIIKNDYSYLYESENGSAYIKIDEAMTSSTAWRVKEEYPELMQTKLGEYHVYNRQLAEYLNYPLLQNNNQKLTEAIKQLTTQELTPERIHEAYPTLSEEEKEAWQDTLDSLFQSRVTELRNEVIAPLLDFRNREDTRSNRTKLFFQYGELDYKGGGHNIVGMKFFEIEDRLQPIKEYIQTLKESEIFKSLENPENILQKALIKNANFIQKRVGIDYELTEENRAKFIVGNQYFLVNEKGHLVDHYQGEEQHSKPYQDKTSTRKETIARIEQSVVSAKVEEHQKIESDEVSSVDKSLTKDHEVSNNLFRMKEKALPSTINSKFKDFDFSISQEERDDIFKGLKGRDSSQFLFDEALYLGRRDKAKEEIFNSMIHQNIRLYDDYEKSVEQRLNDYPEYVGYFHSEDGIVEMEKLFIDRFKGEVQRNLKDKSEGLISGDMPNLFFTAIVDNGGVEYEHINEEKITPIDYVNIVAYIQTSENGNEFFPLRIPLHEESEKYAAYVQELPLGRYTEIKDDGDFNPEELESFERMDHHLKSEYALLELFQTINNKALEKHGGYGIVSEDDIGNSLGQLLYLAQRNYSELDETEQGWLFEHYRLNHLVADMYQQIMIAQTDKALKEVVYQWMDHYPNNANDLEMIRSGTSTNQEQQDVEDKIIEMLDVLLREKLSKKSLYDRYGIHKSDDGIAIVNNLTKERIEVEIKSYNKDELSLKVDELLKIGAYLHLDENGKFQYEYDASKHEIKVLNVPEHYTQEKIESIFIHRAVVWEMAANNYIFDLGEPIHRELLENELGIIVNLDNVDEEQIEKNRKKLLEIAKYIYEKTGLEGEWMDKNLLEFQIGEVIYLIDRDADTTVYNSQVGIENGVYHEIDTGLDVVVEEMLTELSKENHESIEKVVEGKKEIQDKIVSVVENQNNETTQKNNQHSSLDPKVEQKKSDFVIIEEEKVGAKTKFRNNINALDVIVKLDQGIELTTEERIRLSKYTGWGGIPQSFYKSDNTTTKGWEREAEELKSLMGEKEYGEARRSTLDSFYTPIEVTKEMWRAIENMGFKGGNILEPSIGIGAFVGTMPTKFKPNTKVYGVELDSSTAKIVTELYPSVKVYNTGFQNFSMDHVPVTLVIGNPPFGDIKYEHHDKEENAFRKLTIHNYFMAKAIDSLEEGGVMAMVVSNAFLDAKDDTTRKYIHKSSDLLDAIRLPNNAFKDSAHTEVTTDILFFRKRLSGERVDYDGWVHLDNLNDTPINKYFTYREENLLGEWGRFGTMYGGGIPALISKEGQDTKVLLKEAIDRVPQKMEIMYEHGGSNNQREEIFFYAKGNITKEEKTLKIGESNIKIGSLFVQESVDEYNRPSKEINLRLPDVNGEPRFKKIDYLLKRTNKETGEVEVTINHKQIERVEGMIVMVKVANDLRKAQIDKDYSNEDIESIRRTLNSAYDTFVKKQGYLSSMTNKRLFSFDVDAPFLLSLERKYDKGVTATVAKKTGEAVRKPSAIKAEIFTKRTQYPYMRPEKAKNEEEALYIALGESGFVDIAYMSSLLNQSESQIEKSLEAKGFIFNDPIDGWVPREEYLSGDVKKKYKQTIDLNYLRELERVVPKDIEPYDISVQFGAGWIPESDMNDFLKEITENKAESTYVPFSADWTININPTDSSRRKWETDRADFKKIIVSALNNKQIVIHDSYIDGNGNVAKRVNEDATIAANDKMEALKETFDKWIWSSEERRERLGRVYNDKFNRYAPREYDGSHLKFVGKVDDSIFELRPHQRNAVYRAIVEGKILLDHTVGTGKTATLICTVMEMNRMNKVNKQLLAVPNHLVGQWAKEWLELYPNANILASDKKDFEKANRQLLFSKMTTGNYDVIIIAHSQLTKIQNDPAFTRRFLYDQIETINNAIDQVREIEGKDTRTVKQYEKTKAKLEDQVETLLNLDRDELVTFKELGVDALAVDEVHEFKNLQYTTSLQRVGGLGNPEGSKKAFDLFIKARMLGEETGEKNLFFLTGTPISNTIAEMYTMQKYMDYNQLKENDILHFDAWVKQYAEVVSDWELSPSGKYQMRSRLSKFKNMPELMQSYRSFSDVVTREQIQAHLAKLGKRLAVPDMIGGKPNNVINERSEQQAIFIGIPDKNGRYPQSSLVYRSEHIPKKPKKGDDNMLVIMSEARKCALDMRLIDSNAPDDKNSKVNIMIEHLLSQYKLWNDFQGTQLIFCDLSTPKNSSSKEKERIENLVVLSENGTGDEKRLANRELNKLSEDDLMALKSSFDVYNDIKSKLIKKGIPEEEIAFIHDANTDKKKAELFDLVNGGKVRFLLGSTSKMGAGMNAQQKLVGLHHLDAPWRPSDLEQREGRIIRQGNFIYNLFDVAKKYSEETSMEYFKEFSKALKLMGMKEDEFQEALEKLPLKKFEVMVNRYATKATLDSRMWQTLETKAKFIEQIKLAGFDEREVEDITLESSNSAEMKAISSGNPLILEEMTLKKEIKKLEALSKNHMFTQFSIEKDIERLSKIIEKFPQKLEEYEEDIKRADEVKNKIDSNGFSMLINNKIYDNRINAGSEIMNTFYELLNKNSESINFGKLGEFNLFMERSDFFARKGMITLEGKDLYELEMDSDSNSIGISTKIVNLLNKPIERHDKLISEFENAKIELPKIKSQVSIFDREDELALFKNRYKQVIVELRPKEDKEEDIKESENSIISSESSDKDMIERDK